ncbi:hopanoid biosynthesis protein HpnM (plasmid) [Azospirillum baldaniorum]|uniref:Hopanoid biosynthesis associated membrane protein HpnM n=2 Tax=Azospirillum baldaniorum TaxID=1064539 RepID=A0A9P1JUU9_9PROT|nr:ABC transporter substrate-binding protein [Azospirillum baldaniorum]AWJ91779.1 hopanoid biosynthesis protein HpnM [Azospirillum baldaniorum]TWA52600.1 phospholipid transport system substrate-binding protein [Azospirillum baldaniorum]TWA83342.1 phospholipid transport system substrate-binding protein [Azospirillum brasilense]CCD00143.1 putative Hopanoid biosynthesis associated membrane protein HpnM [Azospirillum baldaniorum]
MRAALALAVLAAGLLPVPAVAQQAGTTPGARATVARLNDAILSLMREAAGREPARVRLQRFLPVMLDTFDLEAALRVAAAPYFDQSAEPEKRQALDAFARRSAAQYVDRFDSYDGQRLEIVGERPAPRGMLLVDTDLVRAGKTPVRLSYLLRPEGDRWRILDVLAKGTVSQLATQRSEFQNTLRGGGLAALTRDLNSNADRILGGA